jgi:hypothetical protein
METRASIPLDAIRRPRNTSIWKLETKLAQPIPIRAENLQSISLAIRTEQAQASSAVTSTLVV